MSETLRLEWQKVIKELNHRKRTLNLTDKSDNKSKVKACFSDKSTYDTLLNWLLACSESFKHHKSNEEATKCRTLGNDYFLKRNSVQSLCYYTKAILLAPPGSEELNLAYGNRSAALFELGKFEECISDIKYAETNDAVPGLRKARLTVRKAKALENLKKNSEAVFEYKHALRTIIGCSDEDQKKLDRLKKEVFTNLSKLEKSCESESEDVRENPSLEFENLKDSFTSNPEFPNASSKLCLKKDVTKGRHVVANEDIFAGEVLFLEKPFAFVVLPTYAYERCQNCCKYISNPLPCERCSEVSFCSEQCRKHSWNVFHRWECGFGLNLNYMLGIAHLGFRAAIVGLSDPKSPDYEKVLSLQQHIESFDPDDLFQYTLTATVLVIYLEKFTDIFCGENRLISLYDFGGLILLHIAQMICNGHAITDVTLSSEIADDDVFSEEQVRVATAIYPSASMMNHSCDPSIINGFNNEYLIVRAIKAINAGDEVYNCYGPHFRRMGKIDRRNALLQQYRFHCVCSNCTSDVDFIERFKSFRCCNNSCTGLIPVGIIRCPKCMSLITEESIKSVEKGKQLMSLAKDASLVNQFQKSVDFAENALKLFSKYLYKHHLDILECKDFLAKMTIPLGRYFESYKYVEENIVGNKDRFGDNNIEVANEIVKLSDIALRLLSNFLHQNSIGEISSNFKEVCYGIQQYMLEAKEIIRIHYGERNKKFQDLEERIYLFKSVHT